MQRYIKSDYMSKAGVTKGVKRSETPIGTYNSLNSGFQQAKWRLRYLAKYWPSLTADWLRHLLSVSRGREQIAWSRQSLLNAKVRSDQLPEILEEPHELLLNNLKDYLGFPYDLISLDKVYWKKFPQQKGDNWPTYFLHWRLVRADKYCLKNFYRHDQLGYTRPVIRVSMVLQFRPRDHRFRLIKAGINDWILDGDPPPYPQGVTGMGVDYGEPRNIQIYGYDDLFTAVPPSALPSHKRRTTNICEGDAGVKQIECHLAGLEWGAQGAGTQRR